VQFGTVTLKKQEYQKRLDQAINEDADFHAFNGDNDPIQVLDLATS
jgi:hypothetical protein